MKPHTPPRTLELVLQLMLPRRDRESVSGDLHEGYADIRARKGSGLAMLWYLRQLLSLTPRAVLSWARIPLPLTLVCAFTALCGLWLGAMDIVLHHRNILFHELIAATIVLQAALTLAALRFRRLPALRLVVGAGCVALLGLAAVAIHGLLTTPDFEGYIFLIALALILQVILTVLNFARPSPPESTAVLPVEPPSASHSHSL